MEVIFKPLRAPRFTKKQVSFKCDVIKYIVQKIYTSIVPWKIKLTIE